MKKIFNLGKTRNPPMRSETVILLQKEVVRAAEAKMKRGLTEAEVIGIEKIRSLMMLESCIQSFSAEKTTPDQVQADVDYFASPNYEIDR